LQSLTQWGRTRANSLFASPCLRRSLGLVEGDRQALIWGSLRRAEVGIKRFLKWFSKTYETSGSINPFLTGSGIEPLKKVEMQGSDLSDQDEATDLG